MPCCWGSWSRICRQSRNSWAACWCWAGDVRCCLDGVWWWRKSAQALDCGSSLISGCVSYAGDKPETYAKIREANATEPELLQGSLVDQSLPYTTVGVNFRVLTKTNEIHK